MVLAASMLAWFCSPMTSGQETEEGVLKPGQYRVWVRGECPEYKGESWYSTGSLKFASRGGRWDDKQTLMTWPTAAPSKSGSKPAKYILVFTGDKEGMYNPFFSADQTKKIFSLAETKEKQADFLIECAADVHQFQDIHGSGAWSRLYVVVEYEDGTRAPFTLDEYEDKECQREFREDLVKGPCIRTPKGYWQKGGVFGCVGVKESEK